MTVNELKVDTVEWLVKCMCEYTSMVESSTEQTCVETKNGHQTDCFLSLSHSCFAFLQWAVSVYYRWFCNVLYARFSEPQKSCATNRFALHPGFVKIGVTVMQQLM
jgi:hypothetical protein